MRLLRRRRPPQPALLYPGIRLRIKCSAGSLVEADSTQLYYIAKFGMRLEPCEFSCPPHCTMHNWAELFPGDGMDFHGQDLRIEMQPVLLPGELADFLAP
jgi:hypothetical protein